jgi:hypothetical protein
MDKKNLEVIFGLFIPYDVKRRMLNHTIVENQRTVSKGQ